MRRTGRPGKSDRGNASFSASDGGADSPGEERRDVEVRSLVRTGQDECWWTAEVGR